MKTIQCPYTGKWCTVEIETLYKDEVRLLFIYEDAMSATSRSYDYDNLEDFNMYVTVNKKET